MDDEIEYDGENDYNEDEPIEEGDDLIDEIENLFINAKSSDDPIEAYLNVIELETQNSDQKIFSFRSYREICIIHMINNSYEQFCDTFKKFTETSKKVPDNYKEAIFEEAFLPIIVENESFDYTMYLRFLLYESEKSKLNSLHKEVENFVFNSEKYKDKFIEEKKSQTFSFDKLLAEYEELKTAFKGMNIGNNINNLSKDEEKIYKLRQYESMTINKQIPLIKESVKNWRNEISRKFWSEWVEDYEKFSYLPIFYNEISKVEVCKAIGFNILINLYDTKDSVQAIGFNASMYLYDILSRIFCDYNDADLREYVVTSGMFSYILKRFEVLTEEIPRKYLPDKRKKIDEKKVPEKEINNDTVFKYTKKSKGIGYSSNVSKEVWDVDAYLEKQKKHRNFLIESIISFFVKYFNMTNLKEEILNEMYNLILESALLPCLENLFTENSILELSKNSKLVNLYFQLIENFSKSSVFCLLLKDISPDYKPIQVKSIYNLSKDLINTITIYNKQQSIKNLEKNILFEEITFYFKEIQKNIEHFEKSSHMYETTVKIIDVNNMDPKQAYPLLLKKYAFDYVSMTNSSNQIDHYYAKHKGMDFNYNYNYDKEKNNKKVYTSEDKVLRLVGEFANLQTSLPIEFTNSIFVRVDKDNMDYMKAIIFGSEGTPYSSGAFTYDIYFGNNYPNSPPNVVITSTGNGTVRFNPNLYSTGKVCLSLLGTWRGEPGENWDPKISTVYQVLLSIQSLIMSDLIYYNEPGFEHTLGTSDGEQLNEGYSNIVRYNNIRVCMIDMIKQPPKGFEEVIKIHFYLKKEKILKEVDSWIEKAKNVPFKFDGLSQGHNRTYASRFQSKNTYYQDLVKIREELKNVLYSIKLDASLLSQKIVEKKKQKIQKICKICNKKYNLMI
jgi:ubiquitin-protein ligase